MQSHAELHTMTTRGHSASAAEISWHSSNSAKAYQALSLFANLKANLCAAPAALHPVRHGLPLAAQAHTPTTASGTGDSDFSQSSSPPHRQQRCNSTNSTGTASPSHGAAASTTPMALPTYTEAEIASMSPAQLQRQLRVAAAITQRLYRRSQQLQKQVEEWEDKWTAQQQQQQKQTAKLGTKDDAAGVRGKAIHREAAAQALTAAEQRANNLQMELERLLLEKEALRSRLHEEKPDHSGPNSLPPSSANPVPSTQNSARHGEGSSASPQQGDPVAAAAGGNSSSEVAILRDTVRLLQHRLDLSEERAQRATQIQLDALLQHHNVAAAQHAPTAPMVNAEVQKLFQLMQEQLAANAVLQQVERARMNELLYQLERQRGLM
ncbi:hypothetical protein ABL78_2751 [Leptomonas seymouri]|uniref:Uncharacterized protein n=1 Tax=Leptomonas seymouri TaxID=5684 RepID=A0A0N1I0H2_LEPSE|nr:hypothetical protein ABL78_2751 [Leptomonas seymouri]|eukprot:KPI88174.1 hypothetical protein ABL78_2751 [Leptomonas seymouri]